MENEYKTLQKRSRVIKTAKAVTIKIHLRKHFLSFFFLLFSFCFLWPYLWHTEIPRLGLIRVLQLQACTTPTAIPDSSHICNFHHSFKQHRILNALSEARYQTHILIATSQVLHPLSHNRSSQRQMFSIKIEMTFRL